MRACTVVFSTVGKRGVGLWFNHGLSMLLLYIQIAINRLIIVYMNVIMWISSHIDLLPRIGGEICIVCIGMRLFPNFESRLLYWDG